MPKMKYTDLLKAYKENRDAALAREEATEKVSGVRLARIAELERDIKELQNDKIQLSDQSLRFEDDAEEFKQAWHKSSAKADQLEKNAKTIENFVNQQLKHISTNTQVINVAFQAIVHDLELKLE